MIDLARHATRSLFFTGKGGVGKTSVACATAIALADAGKRVLLVSTDPASNLDEVLGTRLTTRPGPVAGVPGLWALNIDPEAAARAYRERLLEPHRGRLSAATLAAMEEQLSGACTVEIAAFDEFARLLGDPESTSAFDHVLYDTAPTGHTLRLLALPAAWNGFLEQNALGTSCLGPLAGLERQRALYHSAVGVLADGALTTVVLVARADPLALAEAARTAAELAAIGLRNQRLVVNALLRPETDDPVAGALAQRQAEALAGMPAALHVLPRLILPLRPGALIGMAALRSIDAPASDPAPGPGPAPAASSPFEERSLRRLVDELAVPRGVIFAMGKGGVGKTTVAAAIAVELARRGLRVHLSTTDPAAHLSAAVGQLPPGLRSSRIDPAAEVRRYASEAMDAMGAGLDAAGRALLDEDLRSPCTEEIAVFRAFARIVADGDGGVVVLDTAPTGHTLLLLDAAESYHRAVARQARGVPEEVRRLLPRLRDPAFARVVLVTVPEPTPVHEAQALQRDLERAGIAPFAWVVNQSLGPVETREPVLAARRAAERPFIEEVCARACRVAVVPWLPASPRGWRALASLSDDGAERGPKELARAEVR